jgi:hypothetical protein
MITSSKSYPFGGKVSTLQPQSNPHGMEWWVNTAKDGFFSKQSTQFLCVTEKLRTIEASFKYADHISSTERLKYHDYLTEELDKVIDSGEALSTCIDPILKQLKKKNVGIGMRFGREIDTAGYVSDELYVRNRDGTWSPKDNS